MTDKIVLLDIDGVLSPYNKLKDNFFSVVIGERHVIEVPNTMIPLLTKMKENTLIWESTWGKESNALLNKLGLSNSKYFTYPKTHTNFNNNIWLKEPSISYFVKTHPDEMILLIDDDVPNNSKLYEFKNLTIIKPNPKFGINNSIYDNIIDWLN